MKREPIETDSAPAAIGTYSQAIRSGDTLYISGQIPLVPATGAMIEGDVRAQIRQVFDNLRAVANAADASLDNAVKINVYLVDLANFGDVNEIMADYLKPPFPARAAVQVAALPRGAAVEADAIIAL